MRSKKKNLQIVGVMFETIASEGQREDDYTERNPWGLGDSIKQTPHMWESMKKKRRIRNYLKKQLNVMVRNFPRFVKDMSINFQE